MINESRLWLIIGMGGQAIFSARFLMQWIYSEFRGESAIPLLFWYASIVGGIALLAYAIYRRDPVFIVGQASGLLVYVRNVQLRLREARQCAAEASR